jgi:plastocyanin
MTGRPDRSWLWLIAAATVVTLAAGVFAVVAAVTSEDDGDGASGTECTADSGEQVTIAEFAFQPADVSVPAGTCITWTNDDPDVHNLRSADDVISSPDLTRGEGHSVTFDEPGTYEYVCGIHSFMTGSVTVTE